MFFFGSKKKKSQTHLVVSVESSHIRACFVSVTPHQKPFILVEHIQKFSEDSQPRAHLTNMKSSLHKTLQTLLEKHPTKVSETYCVLGTSWYFSRTYTHTHDEETPFLFRERDSKKILRDADLDFKQELSGTQGVSPDDLQSLEKNIVHIALNGYEVSSLSRHHVRRVELTSYVSYGYRSQLEEIQEEIRRHVSAPIHIHTSTLVQYVVARDAFEYLENFVLVSLAGKETEVTLVQHGALVFGTTFPLGDSLVEDYAKKYGYTPATILSELSLLSAGTLRNEASQPVSRVIQGAEEEWRQAFFDCIKDMSRHTAIPNQVIVLSKPKTFFWVQRALGDARNKHLSISDSHLHAILMNVEAIQPFVGSKIVNPDLKLMMYASFTTLRNIT
jgi:hypothetical protein